MTDTLLSICQNAIGGILNYEAPASIVGNSAPEAVLLLNCASHTGRDLERGYKWQALKRPYSFNTVGGVAAYSLPSDMRRFANLTFWSNTDRWPLLQASNATWRQITSGVYLSGIRFFFSVFQSKLNLNPTPSSVIVIAYDYYSKQFCTAADGVTGQTDWVLDTDRPVLDAELMTLGVRYKFKARHGLPFPEERGDYFAALNDLLADDTPKPVIDVGVIRRETYNLPGSFSGFAVAGSPVISFTDHVTLMPNVTTTTVINAMCHATSIVVLEATTADAAASLPSVSPIEGSFTITHLNNAQTDRIFTYLIIN